MVKMYYKMVRLLSVYCLVGFGFLHATWTPPDDLSAVGQDAVHPQIAVDANGNATAVWQRRNGPNFIIQASTKSFGGNWQATPDDLSAADLDTNSQQIAVGANGNAAAVWTSYIGSYPVIQASTKPFGESWQATPDVLSADDQYAFVPQIAVDANGNATAVWMGYNGAIFKAKASTKPFGESWQATPDDLSADDQTASFPQIAVDANGNATAVWMGYNGTNNIIHASTKPFGGSWQATPDNLSANDQNASFPQIAVDANGNATAVWMGYNGTNSIIQASTKPFGGNWQATPDDLSANGQVSSDSQIAVDANGNATAVWNSYNGTNIIVHASTKPFGESWQATPDNLSTDDQNASFPQIAVDANGNATAVWSGHNGTNSIIQASTQFFAPSVTQLNPNSGPADGGTTVIINGHNFVNVTDILFGTTSAISYSVDSPTSITAPAPAGTGTVNVTVVTNAGTSPITANDQYTYTSQPIPTAPTKFRGRTKHSRKKLFLKTSWKNGDASNIVRYEIFARNKRIKVIAATQKARAIIHLHPHHIPHKISKKYRHYLQHKYKIRAINFRDSASAWTFLDMRR